MESDVRAIEEKWQKKWQEDGVYEVDIAKAEKKFYCLVMFPYPSGDKLHVGHWYGYAPVDSYARFMKMRGSNVFEPMGFDSFGLPAENYAIKTGTPPAQSTMKNVEYMRKQLRAMGTMYDWSKEVVTSEPDYYKWTQAVFLKLYEQGLAYKRMAPVNWCPKCQTVLANEQVVDGHCERCDTEVTKKDLEQWFFRIREYSEDLLIYKGLDWPEKTKLMQEHWIGKSEGVEIDFKLAESKEILTCYTTRPDTIYSVTFIVVSPEHPWVKKAVTGTPYEKEVNRMSQQIKKQTDIERTSEGGKDKLGAFTGKYVVNPATNEKIPVYIANFVLMYGTGIVMADAHDQRDFEFARKYKIPLKFVISKDGTPADAGKAKSAYVEDGILFDSGAFSSMNNRDALPKIADWLVKRGVGKKKTNYKLRDWLISRQRYWGAPIPIVYDPSGKPHPIPEKHLPWLLPTDVDYLPKGKSPLESSKEFIARTEKIFGKAWRPEFDTLDTFVDSSWYFLRYLSPQKKDGMFDMKLVKKWLPVDLYVGGPEHACMHLLYARFIHKVLVNDRKSEPFMRLVHQGLITNKGAKMSKSKGNVVSPDGFVEKYGSDIFRMYLMFMGPFTQGGDWSDKGINGIARFIDRAKVFIKSEPRQSKDKVQTREIQAQLNRTIKGVTEDIEKFHFNTAISKLMEFVNFAFMNEMRVSKNQKKIFVQLLAPLAPHHAEEFWEMLSGKNSVFLSEWPSFDHALAMDQLVWLAVQVNGKMRGKVQVPASISKEGALQLAKGQDSVHVYIKGKKIRREIYVPGRIVNLVVE